MSKFVPRYATGYGISAQNLFTRFKTHYIKNCTLKEFKEKNKKKVAARVFIYAFYLILKDVIDNSTTFVLPTQMEAYIEMNRVEGDDFILARQRGVFKDVDFLKSNFCGHQLQFRHKLKSGIWRKKPILVHKKLKDIITENTNKGMRYY